VLEQTRLFHRRHLLQHIQNVKLVGGRVLATHKVDVAQRPPPANHQEFRTPLRVDPVDQDAVADNRHLALVENMAVPTAIIAKHVLDRPRIRRQYIRHVHKKSMFEN
jgi:hypothetical protein